jgi:5-methyltetrahydrofolate--homocysteine methyltransferase
MANPTSSVLQLLSSGRILLSDGAMGTELQKRGLPAGSCPEEFNVSHPDIVREIHKAYFDAGSDLVETNSFGGNRSRLTMHGYEHRVHELCLAAAQRAREACPQGKFVAGSIGPTGDLLEPFGSRTPEEAFDIFAEQAEALAEGGVDLVIVETMMAVEEAEVAVRAAKVRTSLPVVATMTFEKSPVGLRTMWGVDVATAVLRLSEAGADIIGANCGRGFDEMFDIMTEMRPLTQKPIAAQANAGMPEIINGESVYRQTPDVVLPLVEKLLNAGVNIIGGCCGTSPAHIKAMRAVVDFRNRGV